VKARVLVAGVAAATALAGAFGAGYATALHSSPHASAALANKLEGYNTCLRDLIEQPPQTRLEPHAFYVLFDAFLSADDCAKINGIPFLSTADFYAIAGVRWLADPPPATDPLWLHPDVPRKPSDEAGWTTGLRPAGTFSTWTSP
jgi:hypothetical protein